MSMIIEHLFHFVKQWDYGWQTWEAQPIKRLASRARDRGGVGSLDQGVAANHVAVPAGAGFQRAALGLEIHMDDAETPGSPEGPLKVVKQGPNEVAASRNSPGDGF